MYLHSQGACRLEGRFLIESCAQEGIALCLFDFLGSGVSSGEYVSLGLFEQLQVEQVINFITDKFKIGTVGIWGRSMGAVTALLYAENNSFRISGMVRRENNTRCSTVHLVH
jgi:alpha-beta hydrolase superfamily lysophospholipase